MADSPTTLIRCGAVRDAGGVSARPGAVAVRERVIVAAGEEREVRDTAGGRLGVDRVIDLPDTLITPAMVNAHAHLDLTDLGPRPYGGDFIEWVRMVMRDRPTEDDAITAALRRGLKMSRDAGVGLLGDIAGTPTAVRARIHADAEMQIAGTSWLECVGIGKAAEAAAEKVRELGLSLVVEASRAMEKGSGVTVGYQPHAPYSAGLPLYKAALSSIAASPSTHLAETQAEVDFIREATGPFVDLLKQLGKWDDDVEPTGLTPVAYLREVLEAGYWIVAHCNYVTDEDIELLHRTDAVIVYCPVASDYFGHRGYRGYRGHRYRDMLAAGIDVCLGTDSIVCQPANEAQPLGVLPQIRHLYRRDDVDPIVLLAMATLHGAATPCFFGQGCALLAAEEPAHLLGVRFDADDDTDPLVQVLLNDEPARAVGEAGE